MKSFLAFWVICLVVVLLGTPTIAGGLYNVAGDEASQARHIEGEDFACGPDLTCDSATQYCYEIFGGPKGVAPGYKCVDVSGAVSPPTCETIPDIGIGCECTDTADGVKVTCTAP